MVVACWPAVVVAWPASVVVAAVVPLGPEASEVPWVVWASAVLAGGMVLGVVAEAVVVVETAACCWSWCRCQPGHLSLVLPLVGRTSSGCLWHTREALGLWCLCDLLWCW